MDKLSFRVVDHQLSKDGRGVTTVDVQLCLNGTVYERECLSLITLLTALKSETGKCYIFTCTCGEAGCAGYFNWAHVTTTGSELHVDVSKCEVLTSKFGKGKLVFDRAEAAGAVEKCFSDLEAHQRLKRYYYDLCDRGNRPKERRRFMGIGIRETIDRRIEEDQKWERMMSECCAALGEFSESTFTLVYDGHRDWNPWFEPEMCAETLIRTMMNGCLFYEEDIPEWSCFRPGPQVIAELADFIRTGDSEILKGIFAAGIAQYVNDPKDYFDTGLIPGHEDQPFDWSAFKIEAKKALIT